jgi:hypothetical protein
LSNLSLRTRSPKLALSKRTRRKWVAKETTQKIPIDTEKCISQTRRSTVVIVILKGVVQIRKMKDVIVGNTTGTVNLLTDLELNVVAGGMSHLRAVLKVLQTISKPMKPPWLNVEKKLWPRVSKRQSVRLKKRREMTALSWLVEFT